MDPIIKDAVSDVVLMLILSLVGILVPLVFAVAKTAIVAVPAWLKGHVSAQQYQQLVLVAQTAVRFAEQVAANKNVQLAGQQKYAEAEAAVNSFLGKHGLSFTTEQIRVAIEAAVQSELNGGTNGASPAGTVPTPPAPSLTEISNSIQPGCADCSTVEAEAPAASAAAPAPKPRTRKKVDPATLG